MAGTIATAGDNFGDRIKSWPDRIKSFYNDVRTEMKKVTSPAKKEVRGTTTVVIITVFLFGLFFFVVDYIISHTLEQMLHYLSRH